jgi:hypothetical protein
VPLDFNFFDFIVLALATFRLSVLAANDWEIGPRGLLARLRKRAGVDYSPTGEAFGEPGSFAEGLLCNYCNSLWFGGINAVVYLVLLAVGWPAWAFFLPFALSGFTVLVFELKNLR